jgi:hypothetical protein
MARRRYGARALTSTERGQLRDRRKRRLAMVDDFNVIVSMLSREDVARFEASGILPRPFLAALQEQIRLIAEQNELNLELWQIATGECRDGLFRHELLALQCCAGRMTVIALTTRWRGCDGFRFFGCRLIRLNATFRGRAPRLIGHRGGGSLGASRAGYRAQSFCKSRLRGRPTSERN